MITEVLGDPSARKHDTAPELGADRDFRHTSDQRLRRRGAKTLGAGRRRMDIVGGSHDAIFLARLDRRG